MSDLVKEIKEKLIELSEPEYAKFSSGLIPGATPGTTPGATPGEIPGATPGVAPGAGTMLGVRIPKLRNLAKEIATKDWEAYLQNAKDDTFEEVMLQGLILGYVKKRSLEDLLPHLDIFVKKINNWSVCDCVCAGLKIAKKEPEIMWEYLQKYFYSDKEFEIRFAVVMGMDYFMYDVYLEEYLKHLTRISHEGYYVKMAVAWGLSVAYVHYPDRMFMYFLESKLDDFTHNKAIQKIRESYRVSKEDKERLKSLKRKKGVL